jgi:hypothetical protein
VPDPEQQHQEQDGCEHARDPGPRHGEDDSQADPHAGEEEQAKERQVRVGQHGADPSAGPLHLGLDPDEEMRVGEGDDNGEDHLQEAGEVVPVDVRPARDGRLFEAGLQERMRDLAEVLKQAVERLQEADAEEEPGMCRRLPASRRSRRPRGRLPPGPPRTAPGAEGWMRLSGETNPQDAGSGQPSHHGGVDRSACWTAGRAGPLEECHQRGQDGGGPAERPSTRPSGGQDNQAPVKNTSMQKMCRPSRDSPQRHNGEAQGENRRFLIASHRPASRSMRMSSSTPALDRQSIFPEESGEGDHDQRAILADRKRD